VLAILQLFGDKPGMPRAALFDMDKTLIRENSARSFTRFRRARGEVGLSTTLRVSWWLLRYWFGSLDAASIAQKALREYQNTSEADMLTLCDEWFEKFVRMQIADSGRRAVEMHRQRGDRLIIASSATQFATRPLLAELKMDDIVCSMVGVERGVLTGQVVVPICYGLGKLELTRKYLEGIGATLEGATFYSDSITDLPLLEAVGTPVAVNPDLRLYLEARRRGWRIERW
jgi:HAD superfamily hydrolase (TIGR01490 family)